MEAVETEESGCEGCPHAAASTARHIEASEVQATAEAVVPPLEGAMALRMVVLGHSRQHQHSGPCHSVDQSSVSLQTRDYAVLYGISV